MGWNHQLCKLFIPQPFELLRVLGSNWARDFPSWKKRSLKAWWKKNRRLHLFPFFPFFFKQKTSHQITQIAEFFHCHIFNKNDVCFWRNPSHPKGGILESLHPTKETDHLDLPPHPPSNSGIQFQVWFGNPTPQTGCPPSSWWWLYPPGWGGG